MFWVFFQWRFFSLVRDISHQMERRKEMGMEIYIFSFMLMGIQAEVQQVASSSNLRDLVHSRYKPEIPGVENDGKLGGWWNAIQSGSCFWRWCFSPDICFPWKTGCHTNLLILMINLQDLRQCFTFCIEHEGWPGNMAISLTQEEILVSWIEKVCQLGEDFGGSWMVAVLEDFLFGGCRFIFLPRKCWHWPLCQIFDAKRHR